LFYIKLIKYALFKKFSSKIHLFPTIQNGKFDLLYLKYGHTIHFWEVPAHDKTGRSKLDLGNNCPKLFFTSHLIFKKIVIRCCPLWVCWPTFTIDKTGAMIFLVRLFIRRKTHEKMNA